MIIKRVDGDYDEYDHQGHDTVMTCECMYLSMCTRFFMCVNVSCAPDNVAA